MKKAGMASVVVTLILLAGCSAAAEPGPGPLATIVAADTFSDRASDACRSISPDGFGPMVASYDSTAGDVRELATEVVTKSGWDAQLPASADTYTAVCIYDVSETLNQRVQYAAAWVGFDESGGGMGLISVW
jgi:hypothetical protein